MKLLYKVFFLFLITFSHLVSAQIKGTIIDKTTHQPIIGASIYVNNTTYGCQSNIDGQFELQYFPTPPFQIIISSVGYQSASFDVKDPQTSNIQISLKPKATDLKEIVILAPDKNGWAKYGEQFTRNFIGYSAFAKACDILNKKVLQFRDDKAHTTLRVSADEPLKIKNKATGYLITYWLDDYELNYRTNQIFYKGNIQFEPLESKDKKISPKKIKTYIRNRQSSYYGSMMHFMRAVYNNKVYEDSFELRIYREIPTKEYGATVPFLFYKLSKRTDTLIENAIIQFLHYPIIDSIAIEPSIAAWLDTSKNIPSTFSLKENRLDSTTAISRRVEFTYNPAKPQERWLKYYDYNYIPPDTTSARLMSKVSITNMNGDSSILPPKKKQDFIAYLWIPTIPLDSFVTRLPNNDVVLKFNDFIQVTYLKEKEEQEYMDGQFPRKSTIPENQHSLIMLKNPFGVHVLADGNYYDGYDLIMKEYWGYERKDKVLPLDYEPGK